MSIPIITTPTGLRMFGAFAIHPKQSPNLIPRGFQWQCNGKLITKSNQKPLSPLLSTFRQVHHAVCKGK